MRGEYSLMADMAIKVLWDLHVSCKCIDAILLR